MIGDRMKPKQEVCHLIRKQRQVYSSHTFVSVNLNNDSRRLVLDDDDDDLVEEGSTEEGSDEKKKKTVTLMTLVDAYANRHK